MSTPTFDEINIAMLKAAHEAVKPKPVKKAPKATIKKPEETEES